MSPDPIPVHFRAEAEEISGKKLRLNNGVLVRLEVSAHERGALIGAVEVTDSAQSPENRVGQPGRHWGYLEESDLFYTYRSQLFL